MNKRHKYFRNKKYKAKLERRYRELKHSYNPSYTIVFYTNDGEKEYVRPNNNDQPYSIAVKTYRERDKQLYKRYNNKRIRYTKQELKNGCYYKKVEEYWWLIY